VKEPAIQSKLEFRLEVVGGNRRLPVRIENRPFPDCAGDPDQHLATCGSPGLPGWQLEFSPAQVRLVIADDGKVSIRTISARPVWPAGPEERVRLLQGNLQLQSEAAEGHGSEVVIPQFCPGCVGKLKDGRHANERGGYES